MDTLVPHSTETPVSHSAFSSIGYESPGDLEAEIATEHKQRILDCVSIVHSHYEHGASSVSIADVSNFKTPEELEELLAKMSNEHVAYIHGMLTGKRIPRPASMGGPTSDSLKK